MTYSASVVKLQEYEIQANQTHAQLLVPEQCWLGPKYIPVSNEPAIYLHC